MNTIDEELKELAASALLNAFWASFSALANRYLAASAGLDIAVQEMRMGEMTSIYGRDTGADAADVVLSIWSQNTDEAPSSTTGFSTLLGALEYPYAKEIYLQGEEVFERRNGEWYFTGD